MIQKVRGTQDALDLKLHNYLKKLIENHLQNHNFAPIQTPTLEHTKLFTHSLGEQTDVVSKEMYVFPAAEGDESIALRPEGTASVIRSYLENSVDAQPWKVYTYGSMFRRERPQKGRWREFMQWSIEVVNSPSITQDAHFLAMLNNFFANIIKLENYELRLNYLTCAQDRADHRIKLNNFLDNIMDIICETCKVRKEKNILRIFDCKNETCKAAYKTAPKITDVMCGNCDAEWNTLQGFLTNLNIKFIHDPYIVRGLDYYVGTAFEFVSNDLGAQATFCGGGRYELAQTLGNKTPVPSLGAGIGMGRLMMLFDTIAHKHTLPAAPKLHVILPFDTAYHATALQLAQQLLAAGFCTDVLVDSTSAKTLLKKANKLGASIALIIGEEEYKAGNIMVKDMVSGNAELVKQEEIVAYLKSLNA